MESNGKDQQIKKNDEKNVKAGDNQYNIDRVAQSDCVPFCTDLT